MKNSIAVPQKNFSNISGYIAFGGILFFTYTEGTVIFQNIYHNPIISFVLFVIALLIYSYKNIMSRKICVTAEKELWIFVLVLVVLNIIVSKQSFYLGQPNIVWICSVFLMLALSRRTDWYNIPINIMLFFIGLHVVLSWLLYFFPQYYLSYIIPLAGSNEVNLMTIFRLGGLNGITIHYSVNGMYMAVGLIIFYCKYLCSTSKRKKKWLIGVIILFITLLMTRKRGVSMFATITMIIMYMIYRSKSEKAKSSAVVKLLIVAVIAIVAMIILANTFLPSVMGVIDRFFPNDGSSTTGGRFIMWWAGFCTFLNHPLFGVGWGNYSKETGLAESCSTYFGVLSEMGIIGFVPFMLAMFFTLRKSLGQLLEIIKGKLLVSENDKLAITVSVSVQSLFLLYSLTGQAYILLPMYVPYFLTCAMSMSMTYKYKNQTKK